MNTQQMIQVSKVRLNKDNPRFIRDENFEKLKNSLADFPEMTDVRPIVVDENMVILGGNMRFRAMKDLGYSEVPVVIVEGWSDEQKREFIIKDNASFGEWDWEALSSNFDVEELADWGVDVPNFDTELEPIADEPEKQKGLSRKELLQEIEKVLDGIDRDELNDGWWPTSTGVAFGAGKLEIIRELFNN